MNAFHNDILHASLDVYQYLSLKLLPGIQAPYISSTQNKKYGNQNLMINKSDLPYHNTSTCYDEFGSMAICLITERKSIKQVDQWTPL